MKRRPYRWCLQGSLLLLFLPFSLPISVVHFSFCCHYNRIKLAFAFICMPLIMRRSFNYSSMSLFFFFFSAKRLLPLSCLLSSSSRVTSSVFPHFFPSLESTRSRNSFLRLLLFQLIQQQRRQKSTHAHTHTKERKKEKKEHHCCCTNDITCQHRQLLTCAVGVQRDAAPQHPPPQRR